VAGRSQKLDKSGTAASKSEIERRSTRPASRSTVDLIMKLKTLTKKIRRLETRLQEGPKKLARLKRKLEALMTANAAKARRKSAARDAATRKKKRRSTVKSQVESTTAKRPSTPRKVKRKLNLSPERRAQLAAAMKARWAAKRAVTAPNPTETPTNLQFHA
jgi:chromosome segregation ATPase